MFTALPFRCRVNLDGFSFPSRAFKFLSCRIWKCPPHDRHHFTDGLNDAQRHHLWVCFFSFFFFAAASPTPSLFAGRPAELNFLTINSFFASRTTDEECAMRAVHDKSSLFRAKPPPCQLVATKPTDTEKKGSHRQAPEKIATSRNNYPRQPPTIWPAGVYLSRVVVLQFCMYMHAGWRQLT